MRWWGILTALVLVVVFIGTPAMACMVSAADLTPAERDCCEHMDGQCDGISGSGHSCCETTVRPPPPFLSAQQVTATVALDFVAAEAAAVVVPQISSDEFAGVAAKDHPPPGLDHTPVLRI